MQNLDIPDELKNRYLERRRKDVATFEQALGARDFIVLERMGHQIKGNAVSFGYPELESIGREMEIAARESKVEELLAQFEIFKTWVQRQG